MTQTTCSLTDRVRAALVGESPTREVSMFGGLSFMVSEKMVVAVQRDGLLVRVDPERSHELLALPGVAAAEMGAGRAMGPGWIQVAEETLASDDDLSFWIGVALEYHARVRTGSR